MLAGAPTFQMGINDCKMFSLKLETIAYIKKKKKKKMRRFKGERRKI